MTKNTMRTLLFDISHAALGGVYRTLLAVQGILYEMEFGRKQPSTDDIIRDIEAELAKATFAQPVKLHMVSAHDAKEQFMVMKKKGELN